MKVVVSRRQRAVRGQRGRVRKNLNILAAPRLEQWREIGLRRCCSRAVVYCAAGAKTLHDLRPGLEVLGLGRRHTESNTMAGSVLRHASCCTVRMVANTLSIGFEYGPSARLEVVEGQRIATGAPSLGLDEAGDRRLAVTSGPAILGARASPPRGLSASAACR